ncbi:hypothetical protein BOTCAL_0387g00090 [Botryotinia calthae]|uniref:Carboxylesterase type B domain-containing protein n=1 Tax=Botryotinia calthae TaxID=38488 RepID=A0A4Y8CSW2_9HELO|nr:hypothetical protein BOTCAL_0387g00090 [Botryotinia calthae]
MAVNYRLGAFGFLGGSEVVRDGSANLGLLDQRMGLERIADNIAAFGGDPVAVTIWSESAGSMSVFDQLALFDGNNRYKDRPLFRGAIVNSGSITPSEPANGEKAQEIFDTVVEAARFASAADLAKLECLREVDYDTFVGYNSPAFSYAPRPNGRVLTTSPEVPNQK